MNLTKLSLDNHVAVIVALLLATLFGSISLYRLPIQLTPEIQEPEITIKTNWRAASPNEVEAEIIEPQEDVLRGLPGMTKLLAKAQEGRGEITITFSVDMDLRRALVEVINRLNQVPSYPDDVDEPTISTVGGNARAIAWFIIKPIAGNDKDISSYKDYVEEVVQTRFERVPGVARSEVFGGREREIRITFDPHKTASLGIQIPLASKILGGGTDVSGGFVDIGKREYSLRYAGKYRVEDLSGFVIDWREGFPVYLRDIAVVEERLVDRNSFVITKGELSIAVNAQRETGVNVLQVMAGLQEAVQELAKGPLARANLTIEQVYDETTYIDNSINMLARNLALGIVLAIAVLWWFLPTYHFSRCPIYSCMFANKFYRTGDHGKNTECNLPGRFGICGWHGAGRIDHRAGEYCSLARTGKGCGYCFTTWCTPGLGGFIGLNNNHGCNISADCFSRR
jgi:multidrug efflux pump subunit AcrB